MRDLHDAPAPAALAMGEPPHTMPQQWTRESAAVATLERLGYAWRGGQLWAPPLGPRPAWLNEPAEPTGGDPGGPARQVHAGGRNGLGGLPMRSGPVLREFGTYRRRDGSVCSIMPAHPRSGHAWWSDDGVYFDAVGRAVLDRDFDIVAEVGRATGDGDATPEDDASYRLRMLAEIEAKLIDVSGERLDAFGRLWGLPRAWLAPAGG